MARAFGVIALALAMFANFASVAFAQDATPAATGPVAILLVDEAGSPVVGGCFAITDAVGETFTICDEDNDGSAFVDGLSIGDAQVDVVSVPDGYELAMPEMVTIVAGTPASVNLIAARIQGPAPTAEPSASEEFELSALAAPTLSLSVQGTAISTSQQSIATATLSNGVDPSGLVVYTLFQGVQCSGIQVMTSPAGVYGNGQIGSNAYTFENPGSYSWSARYSGDENNDSATSNCVQMSVVAPNLSFTNIAGPSPVDIGDTVTFTMTLRNDGLGDAFNATISAPALPAAAWSVSNSTPGLSCTVDEGGATCSRSILASNDEMSVTLTATASTQMCGLFTNAATATATNHPELPQSSSIQVNCSDVSITKTEDAAFVNAGDNAGFTLVISSAGPADAYGVSVNDPLPAGVSWGEDSDDCSIIDALLTCNLGTLAVGGSTTIHISGVPSISNCGMLSNTATVSATNEPSSAGGNNSDSAGVAVNCPQPYPSMLPLESSVSAGDTIFFTVSLGNIGTGLGKGGTAVSILPIAPGLSWSIVPDVGNPGDCSIVSGMLSCAFGDIPGGSARSVTISSPTTSESCGLIEGEATFDFTNTADGWSSSNVTVNCPDVAVTKTATRSTITVGDEIEFDLTVANPGAGDAYDVTLTDTLPSETEWALSGADAGDCEIASGVLTCSFGIIEGLSSRSVIISGVTGGEDCGTISNSASASASNEPEEALDDNASSATVTITCGTIAVNKTAEDGDGGTPPQEDACFELRVNNAPVADGCTDAQGSLTFANLPVGAYSLYETSAPENYEVSPVWATIVLEAGATETIEITNFLASVDIPVFAITCTENPGTVDVDAVAAGDLPDGCTVAPGIGFTIVEDGGAPQNFTTGANGGFVAPAAIFSTVVITENAGDLSGGFEPAYDPSLLTKTIDEVQPDQSGLVFVSVPSLGQLAIVKFTCAGDSFESYAEFDVTTRDDPDQPGAGCELTGDTDFSVTGDGLDQPLVLTTDQTGSAGAELRVGSYTLTETATGASTSFAITADTTTLVNVLNYPALPTPTPSPSATATPTQEPTVAPSPTSVSPVPTATFAPAVTPTPVTVRVLPNTGSGAGVGNSGEWLIAGMLELIAIAGFAFIRRRAARNQSRVS